MPSVTGWRRSRLEKTNVMRAEADPLEWFLRYMFALLALVVPALVGYDIYFQWRAPALDFAFNTRTGLVYEVPSESRASWAGLWAGDVIVAVDGVPLSKWLDYGWRDPATGNYMMTVEREGRSLTLEIPAIPLAQTNLLALVSAAAAALIFWGIGLLLLLRRFYQREIRLVFLLSQVFAILLLFPLAHPAPSFVPRWSMLLSSASLYVAAPLLLHYYLTFPVTLGTPRQRRWGLGAIYGLALASMILGLSGASLRRLGTIYPILAVVAAVIVLVYVYLRRASPDGRRRLRLVVFGTLTAAIPGLFLYILPLMTGAAYHLPEWLVALFLVAAPLSYLYATVRHSLFGIDRLLNRTLVYALLSLGILLLYLGPFLLVYRFLIRDPLAQIMIAAGLTLLVGLAFNWSRTQVQRLVDQVFYGGWYDYPGVIETVSAALARSINREQLTDVLTRQVPALMQLRPGHLWIGGPEATIPTKSPGPALQFVLSLEGARHGIWTVEPRRDGEDFTDSDRRIFKTLADQAEIALSNVILVETLRRQLNEIRASQESLAQAQHQLLRSREEEQARLARDLHDGPIQSLVGLNMQLGLLLPSGEPSTEASSEVSVEASSEGVNTPLAGELRAMRAEVRSLLVELRQVCAELRPPMLDTLGLGAALRALAEEWSAQHNVAIHLDLPPDAVLRPLPDEVAVNLYRVGQEALANVARHAQAQKVTLCLAWQDARLSLTIQDDGQGFAVPATLRSLTDQGHFGLVGMQERVNLIGGTLRLESAPGRGTTMRVIWQGTRI
jgi:signal transduction histidine kinase